MSLFISSIASGSNGNCYYVGNSKEAVLIDAGISCRETERRMKRLGLSMNSVKAIFVSHEHGDHIRGIPVLAQRYGLPVYGTQCTLGYCGLSSVIHQTQTFTAHQPVPIGELFVTAFPKLHDASEPHSFVVSFNGICVGIFTDIGTPCSQLMKYFSQCHAAFLEANYDENMLENGRYPYHLKKRISGDKGHLSNRQALHFFKDHKSPHLSHLILAHLSKENNCPQLVNSLFTKHANGTHIVVATRYNETPVYAINNSEKPVVRYAAPVCLHPVQASLF